MDFKQEAIKEAQKSPCQKRKVGAIIVNKTGKILARGHNYHPNNDDCEDLDGNTKPNVIHAEIAALKQLEVTTTSESTIYITHPPCKNCSKAIKNHNLEVVIIEDFMKFDRGKLRYGLIPPEATKALAEVLTYGAKKYKPNNWQKADDTSRYIDALYRHLEAWRGGEKFDSESKLPHLAHALTNIAFLIYFEDKINQNNHISHIYGV